MSLRYLLAVGQGERPWHPNLRQVADENGLDLAYSNAWIAAFVHPSCPCIALGEAGCIIGSLFHRHGPARRLASLRPADKASITMRVERALLGDYWGGYVAVVSGSGETRVFRDPSGNFPCYFIFGDGLALFASDAALLSRTMVSKTSVDLSEIGRQLFRAFVPTESTALESIRELLAGFALRVGGTTAEQEPCWSPWSHLGDRSSDELISTERLARTVTHCVQSWASTAERLLLSVSGGLDSSIIAACLAGTGMDVTCLTMFTDDPAGDERPFARTLCRKLGLPLIERPYRLEDIDLDEPLAAHLPRPRDRTQALAHERVHQEVAFEIGAKAFVTGNGGDHIFGYSQTAAPIADRYLAEGMGMGLIRSLMDVCRQTGCSMADAISRAWRISRASPPYQVRPNAMFLNPDFVAMLDASELYHPWLEAPAGSLPGSAAHIATILRAQPNLEAISEFRIPLLNPLVSQPIIEACLKVKSWEWRAGGRDRSLARRAFAGALPPVIADRTVKGTPSRFAARLLDHFREPIRERLLEGRLATSGIADRNALEKALAGERPVPDLPRVRILELVNAEAWIAHWVASPNDIPRGRAPFQDVS